MFCPTTETLSGNHFVSRFGQSSVDKHLPVLIQPCSLAAQHTHNHLDTRVVAGSLDTYKLHFQFVDCLGKMLPNSIHHDPSEQMLFETNHCLVVPRRNYLQRLPSSLQKFGLVHKAPLLVAPSALWSPWWSSWLLLTQLRQSGWLLWW